MKTPCTQICSIDMAVGYCVGCGRTGDEIGAWSRYDDIERARIMAALPERMRTARFAKPLAPQRTRERLKS